MWPRTPPCPQKVDVKTRRKISIQDASAPGAGQRESVQHVLEDIMDRKASIASVLTMGQERMTMKINFYQWLAVKRWEGMEKDGESRWKVMKGTKLQGIWKRMVGRKENEERRIARQSRTKVVKDAVSCV
jgi:hypothetical protein